MTAEIRPMVIADYDAAYALWSETEGMSLCDDDTRERIALYLTRNPGLCFVATVKRAFRRRGIARGLVNPCLTALADQGIRNCSVFVLDGNPDGLRFWEHIGWRRLENDYRTLQRPTEGTTQEARTCRRKVSPSATFEANLQR